MSVCTHVSMKRTSNFFFFFLLTPWVRWEYVALASTLSIVEILRRKKPNRYTPLGFTYTVHLCGPFLCGSCRSSNKSKLKAINTCQTQPKASRFNTTTTSSELSLPYNLYLVHGHLPFRHRRRPVISLLWQLGHCILWQKGYSYALQVCNVRSGRKASEASADDGER